MNTDDKLLTPKEAAILLGIKTNTLAIWRRTKRHNLPFIKIGRLIRYKQCDLINFLKERSIDN